MNDRRVSRAAHEPPPILSLGEAVDRLQTSSGREDLATLHGVSCWVVDFDRPDPRGIGERPIAAPAAAQALRALQQLACPSLAISRSPLDAARAALRDGCDIAIERDESLPALIETCDRRPLAAFALVQLLRHSEGMAIDAGLMAESLVYSTLQGGPEFAAWLASREPAAARRATPGPAVRVQRDVANDGRERLRLSLNRPDKRNAFSREMRDALVEGLHVALADPAIAEIVLDGVGPSFCSGGDLDEFGSFPDPATAHVIRSTRSAARLLAECSDRVRVHLHGACVGAGIELPAFAARVVARADAFFALPETGLGLVPGAGGTVSIPRRIGRQRTAWLALSGARIDASTALRWGLVDEVREWHEDGDT